MKYSYKEIFNIVKSTILRTHTDIDPERLTKQKSLWLDLGIDRLDRIEIIMNVERKLNVSIKNDAKLKSVDTLDDFCAVLYKELNKIPEKKRIPRLLNLFGHQYE